MWVIVHALSGLALGAVAPLGMVLTVLCALLLHILLDLVPHWDYTQDRRRNLWAALDVATSAVAVLGLFFLLDLPSPSLVAAVVSVVPDLDVLDALVPHARHRRWFPSHWRGFPHGSAGPALGILTQLFVILGALALLFAFGE